MLPTFPYSPLPAALTRTLNWGENVVTYDNGEQQADTPFIKPLFVWSIPIDLMLDTKQSSLFAFANDRKGMTRPFLIKDAYEYKLPSLIEVTTNQTNGSTLFFTTEQGWMVRPDTTTCSTLFSAISGHVTLGAEYSIEQDTGVVTINTIGATDYWATNANAEYFRKAKFSSQYGDTAKLWGIFTAQLSITEVP